MTTPASNDGSLKLIFNLLIVPIGALLRVLGVDLMGLRRTNAPSYWKRRRTGVDLTSQF